MPTVTVTDARYGNVLHTGLNGRLHHVQLGHTIVASDALIEHLRGLGATVTVEPERAGPHQEGSGRGPALSHKKASPKKAKPKNKATK